MQEDLQRIDQLEEQVRGIRTQLLLIEKEIETIKARIYRTKTNEPPERQALAAPTFRNVEVTTPTENISATIDMPKVNEEKAAKKPIDWEYQIGRVWLPRVFIFAALFGVIFGFSAAVEAGWLKEPVRVVIGYLVALVLVFVGDRQIKAERYALGHVLIGGSVCLAMLTTFAGHVLYDMWGAPLAFILNIVAIAGGLFGSYRYRSQALGILAVIGGNLVPFLVKAAEPNPWLYVGYESVLYGAFLYYAVRMKYQKLYVTSAVLMHVSFVLYFLLSHANLHMNWENAIVSGAFTQHVILLLVFLRKQFIVPRQEAILFTSFVVTLGWAALLIQESSLFTYSLFIFGCGYSALTAYIWKNERNRVVVPVSIATYALLMWLLQVMDNAYSGISLLTEGTLALMIGFVLSSRWQKINGTLVYAMGLYGFLDQALAGISELISLPTLYWLWLIGTLIVLLFTVRRWETKSVRRKILSTALSSSLFVIGFDFITQLVWLGIENFDGNAKGTSICLVWAAYTYLWTVGLKRKGIDADRLHVVLAIVIASCLLAAVTYAAWLLTEDASENVQYLTVSLGWLLYAAAGIWWGVHRDLRKVRVTGMVIIFLTLLKIIFVDLFMVSMAIRALLFLVVGGAGVWSSRLFYDKKKNR